MKRRLFLLATVTLACVLAVSTSSASAPNWDVSGTWSGASGLVGNLVYKFDTDLAQASGDVTGVIEYPDHGIVRSVVGYVDGNEFYFTTFDSSYWATCWPCTISADGMSFHGYGSGKGGQDVEWEASGQAIRIVMIDIKPGSYPNAINLGSNGVIPVAILSSDTFDAAQVNPDTVILGGAEVAVRGKGSKSMSRAEDANGDGLLDLVVQVETENLDPNAFQDGYAVLTGQTYAGVPVEGQDEITIVPPGGECSVCSCTTIQDGLQTSTGDPIVLGYDQWGYNYQGHIYNGMYCDYHPVYRPGGANHEWCQANYGNVALSMKWNDPWLSNKDCDGDGLLDRYYGFDSYIGSGSWCTNHMWGSYEMDGKTCWWTYFVKIVAAPADAYVEDGFWHAADGTEIGEVIWGAFAIIQEVENDPCAGIHGLQYSSPDHPGLGGW